MATTIEKVILPKMGINQNTSKAVVYGPHELGGKEFPTTKTTQAQKGITHWLRHLRWDKEIANNFCITLSAAQLSLGLTTPILDDVATNIPYLEEGIMSHLRSTLKSLGRSLYIKGHWTPQLQQEGDRSIMKECTKITIGDQKKKITTRQLREIDDVRLFLQIITISNLANLNGTHIDFELISGKWRATSNLLWPRQCAPTAKQWATFQWTLRKTFCVSSAKSSQKGRPFALITPLGDWLPRPRHVQYDAYRNSLSIYHYENNEEFATPTITEYELDRIEDKNKFVANDRDEITIPTGTHPVDIEFQDNNTVIPLQEYGMVNEQTESSEIYYESFNKQALDNSIKLSVATDGFMTQYQVTLHLHGLLQRKGEVEVSKDCNR